MNLFPNRRQVARSALFGGAAALLAPDMTAASTEASAQTQLDARQFGAKGDGKTDDTAALQKALDAAGAVGGAVVLSPGVYVTGELHLRERTALAGTRHGATPRQEGQRSGLLRPMRSVCSI